MPKKSMSVSSDDPRYSECDECGATVMRSNLSRHRMTHLAVSIQRLRSASASLVSNNCEMEVGNHHLVRASSKSGASQLSNPMTHYREFDRQFSSFSFSGFLIASAAAYAVLQQHDRYNLNLNGLSMYVVERFLAIPVEARPYLVIGAAAGAQYASQIYFLAETHEASTESGKHQVAARARCSLSSWAIGRR